MSVRRKVSATKPSRKRATKQGTKMARPRGRPPLPPELRGSRYDVYMTPRIYEAALKIGKNLSVGIAIAVARMAAEEMAREAGQRRE